MPLSSAAPFCFLHEVQAYCVVELVTQDGCSHLSPFPEHATFKK